MVKTKEGYGNLFLKQIDKQILVYSVNSNWKETTEEYNNEKIKFYLELTKDWQKVLIFSELRIKFLNNRCKKQRLFFSIIIRV